MMPVPAVGRPMFWSCNCCDYRVLAMSEPSMAAAMDAHAEYVNATADRATDEYFAEMRIDRLLADTAPVRP